MQKTRLGIIGAGGIVRTVHLPAIKQLPDIVEINAICDTEKARVGKIAKANHIKEVYYDYRDLVKSKNIDAVITATPNIYHKEHSIAAAEQGKHVLCEKPIATNLKDAREFIKICKEKKVKLQIGHNERFWNQVRIAKELIDCGVIGEIKSFVGIFTIHDEDKYEIDSNFRHNKKLSGGGCLLDITVHQIDVAQYLIGDITSICTDVRHSVGGFCAEFEDNSIILCNFKNGAIGSILTNRFSPFMHRIFLYGTSGTIFLGIHTFFQSAPLSIYMKKGIKDIPEIITKYTYSTMPEEKYSERWISIFPQRDDPYAVQLEKFCKSIQEDIEPPVTGQDGLKALSVCLSAYKSSKERKWVEISN